MNITDIISKAVTASTGNIALPQANKNQILGGLSESILGSLTQTATKKGGIDQLKGLLTGATKATESPVTGLATNLFKNNVLKGLNLDSKISGALSGAIPTIMGKLGGILKDQDGDGDVDLQDILLTLKGGKQPAGKSGLLGAATGLLGMLKK